MSWILEPIIGWGRFATLILDRLSAVRALAVEVYHIVLDRLPAVRALAVEVCHTNTGSPVCRAGIG